MTRKMTLLSIAQPVTKRLPAATRSSPEMVGNDTRPALGSGQFTQPCHNENISDLIQFVYGEDGMDGAFIEWQSINTFTFISSILVYLLNCRHVHC
jgi:hypothetical protein